MHRSFPASIALAVCVTTSAHGLPVTSSCSEASACHGPRLVSGKANALDRAGQSIATTGTWTALGAPGAGSVYVWEMVDGEWVETDPISPPLGSSADGFGTKVAMTNDHLVVSAPMDDTNGPESGAVFVYERTPGGWALADKFAPITAMAFSHFGSDVAIDGTDILVGARDGFGGGGAAYLFRDWLGSFVELTSFVVPGSDEFGDSVEIEEPYVYIGDWADDDGGTDAGAVYTFEYSWTSTSFLQKIVAPDAVDFDHFGWDLAVSGLQLMIGAPEKNMGLVGSGAAYMYDGFYFAIPGPPTWLPTQRIVACEVEEAAHFGFSVAMDGKWAIAGAWGSDPNGLVNAGRAYAFRRGDVMPDPWAFEHQLVADDAMGGDGFGFALDLAGLFPIVGALGMDAVGADSGGAYPFAVGRAFDVMCGTGGPVEPSIFERGPALPK